MPTAEVLDILIVLTGVAAFVAVVLLLLQRGGGPSRHTPGTMGGRGRQPRTAAAANPEAFTREAADRPLAAVVINPTKFDSVSAPRSTIAGVCAELGWAEPLWFETTSDDPGVGQARQALERGADVVLACGGDGTVRCVGQALAGTGASLGLLPAGTGNLLARNLDMDLDDIEGATRNALAGDDRAIDVGRVWVDGGGDDDEEQVFLVMAGLGFDAAIMANAPERLKATVGPFAYVVSGLRHLKGAQMRVRLAVDDEPERRRRIRTVVIGNCGKLLGGLELMPDAELDDGRLDVVAIAPQGIAGWAAVAVRLITKQRKGHTRVEHWTVREFTVNSELPQPAQLDGDTIGDVSTMRVRVDPGALRVRVPAAP